MATDHDGETDEADVGTVGIQPFKGSAIVI